MLASAFFHQGRPPMLSPRSGGEVIPDRPHKQNRSRGALMRPSFVHDDHAKIDSLPAIKEGSGAPKGACHPCPRKKRGCALLLKRRARLSALTLAALATGYYPDGSAPEPGFPKTDLAECFARLARLSSVKHAPCGPVFLPVDRGPRAARGHRPSLPSFRLALPERRPP